jgi:hypothetical protein
MAGGTRTAGSRTAARGPVLAAAVTAAVGLLVALSQLQSANDFTADHYLFTYQDGLVRRALVGSLLALATGDAPVSRELVTFLGFGYLALFIGLGATLVGIAWARGDRRTVVLLAVLLVASPQAMVLAYDTGKFDTLLLSLTPIAALAILGGRRSAVIVAALASLVGVLVHEIHAIAGVPLILALLLARHGTSTRSRLLLPLIVGVPVAIAVVAIGLGATTVGGSLESVQALAGARAGFETEVETAVVQTVSFRENLAWTAAVMRGRPLALLATVLVAVPAGVAALLLARRRPRPRSSTGPVSWTDRLGLLLVHPRTPVLAALSPVLLFPIGFDWYRWVAMAVTNLVLLGLWREAGGDRALAPDDVEGPGMPAVVAVLLTLVLSATSPSTAAANLLEHVVRGPFGG